MIEAAGSPGVTMFFVLSGFLITGVIQDAHRHGKWSYGRFAGNRAARLFPGLVLMLLMCAVTWIATGREPKQVIGYAASAGLYLEDFFHGIHTDTIFVHTWSLAVEEQFYLLWPILFGLLIPRSRRFAGAIILALVLVSLLTRVGFAAAGAYSFAYANILTNAWALLAGCFLRFCDISLPRRVRPAVATTAATAGLAAVIALAPYLPGNTVTTNVGAAALKCVLILAVLPGNRVFANPVLRFLGRTSYAWYLWHYPLLWLTGTVSEPLRGGVVALAALAVATASTVFVEEPVRRWWRGQAVATMPRSLS